MRTAETHERCLNGHVLALAGQHSSFDRAVWLHTWTCNLCRDLRLPRASWYEVDHLEMEGEGPSHERLVLAMRRPDVPAGVGQIEVRLHRKAIADLDLRMCWIDERGVIEQVRVDEPYRRRGFGTLLVATALARRPGYRWSTTPIEDTIAARAFWAAQRLPPGLQLGDPFHCSHMHEADVEYV
ncbi:MAG TPA: GNAT family N-acetyltransferase [Amycolatopsis sp.]|nr:GNAT family N-acetyltransferase [Amycolatopsis sp.]